MKRIRFSLLTIAAQMLLPEEREAVLGDVTEAAETEWQGLADILSVILHRQATIWSSWRPWLAGFGLTLPNSLVLMGTSVSLSQTLVCLDALEGLDGNQLKTLLSLANLICQAFLLAAWSWVGGFVAASVSRRTFLATAALCALPCVLCLAKFRLESLPAVSLFLFLPPALLGAHRGLRTAPIKRSTAIPLAVAITIPTLSMFIVGSLRGTSIALLWPAWYLVAAALKPATPNPSENSWRSKAE